MPSDRSIPTAARLEMARLKPFDTDSLVESANNDDPTTLLALVALLDDRDPFVREKALWALDERGGSLARLAARAGLDDPYYAVRMESAEVLGRWGHARDLPRLIRTLKDKNWMVRSSAADGLGWMGNSRAAPALVERLNQDPHLVVRRDSALAIGNIGDTRCLPELEEALTTEKNARVRGAIHYALHQLGKEDQIPEVLSYFNHEDFLARENAIMSIQPDDLLPDQKALVITALQRLLEHESHRGVRGSAERLLSELQESEEA